LASAVAIDPQGRILAAGATRVGSIYAFALARYASDGSLDGAFSGDGKVTTTIFGQLGESAHGVGLDSQGRIVAGGRAIPNGPTEMAVARYGSTGALDPSFGNGGIKTAPGVSAGGMTIDAADRILLVGRSGSASFGLARFIGDATAPTATIGSGPADGSSTNDTTPTFELASNEAGATFTCGLDGATASCGAQFTPSAALGDDRHTFSVVATDRAGNSSPATTRTFTIDTRAPEIEIKGKGKLQTRKPKAKAKLKIKTSEKAKLMCSVDKKRAKACGKTYKPKLKPGKHKVKVTATDRAGNKGSETKRINVVG
jgi:uncharacterized delta-60 repeat protein